jgi:ATP-dependent helicase HrpB
VNRLAARDELPVRRAAQQIVNALADGGALPLTAATGSGKTTQVPQILLASGCVQGEIVILEPRRLAARMTAARVAAELGGTLGGVVGFQTRFERAVSAETRVRFVTDGVFLRQAQRDPTLKGIGAVLLDEFHERSLFADIALGMVSRARVMRSGGRGGGALAVCVMSATMDAGALARYLNAPPMQVEGRAFPVRISYDPGRAGVPIWERAADAVREVLQSESEGDVLVFMPGAFEIDRTMETVRGLTHNLSVGASIEVVGLHGRMSAAAQDAAVAPARTGWRKVIVSTNVAETSITIPGIRAVVDAGVARVFRADPLRGLNVLRVEPISRASADQRAGRAGRTAPGVCIRLWSEREHAQRAANETPEVRRVDLSEAMLMIGGPQKFQEFPWLDAPEELAVTRAQQTLALVGATDDLGNVTPLGRQLVRVPAHPRLARSLVAARDLGVLSRTARWCALAAEREVVQAGSVQGLVRLTPNDEPPSDVAAREALVMLVAASSFRTGRHQGVDASVPACREVFAAAQEMERAVERGGGGQQNAATGERSAPHTAPHTAFEAASCAMIAGFPDHVAWRMDGQRPHCAMEGRRKVSIDKDSIQRGAGFVLALRISEGGRGDHTHQSLGMVSPLERAWVERELPHRFSTRIQTLFSDALGAPAEIEERLFDSIVIEQTVRPLRGHAAQEAAHQELAERVASGQLKPATWTESVDQWIARVRCVAQWMPERKLICYDQDDMRVLAQEIAQGCARASDLDMRPVLEILRNALSWEEQQEVERAAPEVVVLPKGFRMKLEYQPGKPPTGRAKIQDFYDVQGHPSVAHGRVKIRLELLGPNYRPVQITDDLPGFWERLYPEVKKGLKRRYPCHEWR